MSKDGKIVVIILLGLAALVLWYVIWVYTGDCMLIENYWDMPSNAELRMMGWSDWEIYKLTLRISSMLTFNVCG